MGLQLMRGRPKEQGGRLEQELRVDALLVELGISFERVDHPAAETMEACAAIDEALAPATICKNLFLCNAQKTRFYLLMIRGDKKFKTKEISHQIGSARLSFGPAEAMERFLDITPGSVSVMGLMNDTEGQVTLLVDEDVLKGEYIGCHPCVNTSSMRLKTADVFGRFLEAVGHGYQVVRLSATDAG